MASLSALDDLAVGSGAGAESGSAGSAQADVVPHPEVLEATHAIPDTAAEFLSNARDTGGLERYRRERERSGSSGDTTSESDADTADDAPRPGTRLAQLARGLGSSRFLLHPRGLCLVEMKGRVPCCRRGPRLRRRYLWLSLFSTRQAAITWQRQARVSLELCASCLRDHRRAWHCHVALGRGDRLVDADTCHCLGGEDHRLYCSMRAPRTGTGPWHACAFCVDRWQAGPVFSRRHSQ